MHVFVNFGRLCLLVLILGLNGCYDSVHIFEGVEGPESATPLIAPVPASPEDFNQGSQSRLAVYLIDENSNWLGLVRGLKTIGIPFRVTTDYQEALQHDVVMAYPHISGRALGETELLALRGFVRDGGTLIGTNVLGGGMEDVFGFSSIAEGKSSYQISFMDAPETAGFEGMGLTPIKIGSSKDSSLNPGTNSYLNPVNAPIAQFENGGAAIISQIYGRGKSYAFGVDLGQLLAKGYNRRQVDTDEYYINHFQPTLDALLILVKNIYQTHQDNSVTLGTVPDGKSLSFMLSHDVDYSRSLDNAIAYAKHQQDENIQATYFIQTKYVKDYNDKIFLNEAGAARVKELDALGAEIASHSVAHSEALWTMPMGDGKERYPSYKPFVQTQRITRNASILGELRISKFLLEYFAAGQTVDSFRPGFLSNPEHMPEALVSSGYKYSSSSAANVSLTHLPFQLTYGRGFDALTPVFEIPITVEDELPPEMIDRLQEGKELAQNIAKIGGTYVVLIHTDDVDGRLEFQKQIVDEVRPYAWMGSIRQFGDWWSARDKVGIDFSKTGNNLIIEIDAPEPISGLVLEVGENYTLKDFGDVEAEMVEKGLLLGPLSGRHKITLTQ